MASALTKQDPPNGDSGTAKITTAVLRPEAFLKTGPLQNAILNSADFSIIATDEKELIQLFNDGAERMLGYSPAELVNEITPANISDPQDMVARAKALSLELATSITPGFEALVFKASLGIEDIYELSFILRDGSRFPALVSATALRDAESAIIGYLLIGTDDTARKKGEAERLRLAQPLRDQQFYAHALIESNIDSLITTDPAGIITAFYGRDKTLQGVLATARGVSATAPQPAMDAPEPAALPESRVPDAERPTRTLLYVEDDAADLELVAALIARRPNMRLLSAQDGMLGLALARVSQPEVILMDINLPGISGIEALKLLREDPATAHIPVIALSVNTLHRDIAKGLAAGFFRYLTKPFRLHDFVETLDLALACADNRPLPPGRARTGTVLDRSDVLNGKLVFYCARPMPAAELVKRHRENRASVGRPVSVSSH